MANLIQGIWVKIVAALGLPKASLTPMEVLAALLIVYIIYLLFSTGILYLSFKFLKANITFGEAFTTIILRDIIFFPLGLIAFGLGYIFAYFIWIGLLKYRFDLEWGRTVMISLLAGILPAAITSILLLSFFTTIIFAATLL